MHAAPEAEVGLQTSLRALAQQGHLQADLRTRRKPKEGPPGLPDPVRSRLQRWRGRSPLFVPTRPGGKTGMPVTWALWIVQTGEEIPDPILREALATADFAMRQGEASEDQGLYVLSFVCLYRKGLVTPEEGDPILALMREYQKTIDPPRTRAAVSRRGRTRIPTPPGPPAGGVRVRGYKLQALPGDQGLLLYLPGYFLWLRERRQKVAMVSLQHFIRALPDPALVPLPEELARTVEARQGDIPEKTIREAWTGLRLYLREDFQIILPHLPTAKPRPTWDVPQAVARATRTLFGSNREAYLGINRIRREDVQAGSIPTGYEKGKFCGQRDLSRQERDLVLEILAWADQGSDEDPFLPLAPDAPRRSASPRSIWNRVRFERPLWPTL